MKHINSEARKMMLTIRRQEQRLRSGGNVQATPPRNKTTGAAVSASREHLRQALKAAKVPA